MADIRGSKVVVDDKTKTVSLVPGKRPATGQTLKCELWFDFGGDWHLDQQGSPIAVQVNGTTAFTLVFDAGDSGSKNGSADLTRLLGDGVNNIDGYCLAIKSPVLNPTSGRIRLSTDNNVTVVDQSFTRGDTGSEVQHGGPWPFTK
jgi:hypothetical protein